MFVSSALAIVVDFWIAYLVALAVEKRIFDRAIRRLQSLSKLGKCVLCLVLFGLIAWAGTKPSPGGGDDTGGSSTNDVTQVECDANNTNDVGWIEGDFEGTNDVDQVDGDTNSVGGSMLRGRSSPGLRRLAVVGLRPGRRFPVPKGSCSFPLATMRHSTSRRRKTQPLRRTGSCTARRRPRAGQRWIFARSKYTHFSVSDIQCHWHVVAFGEQVKAAIAEKFS